MTEPESRLERLVRAGRFCVTAEVVPPRSPDGAPVTEQARSLVGYADAVNVTDNPTASAHMSPLAGCALVAAAGVEPIMQLNCRDRNRLALTSDLLGAWALGARNLLCLAGDPVGVGDHPDATPVLDFATLDLIRLAADLRSKGRLGNGAVIESAPRFFVGAADVPLADPYDPSRLEGKLDAGARFVQTQITHDVDALSAWADKVRALGFFERAAFIVGVAALRSAKAARYMNEHVPGVVVPEPLIAELEEAGPESEDVGVRQVVDIVKGVRAIPGVAGVHVIGFGREQAVLRVIEGAGLFPRATPAA